MYGPVLNTQNNGVRGAGGGGGGGGEGGAMAREKIVDRQFSWTNFFFSKSCVGTQAMDLSAFLIYVTDPDTQFYPDIPQKLRTHAYISNKIKKISFRDFLPSDLLSARFFFHRRFLKRIFFYGYFFTASPVKYFWNYKVRYNIILKL